MKPINYDEIFEKAEARRAALEAIIPKLQAIYDLWDTLYAAALPINSVNADFEQLDSEAAALLAQSVGVSVSTLGCGLHYLANVMQLLDRPSKDLLEALEPNEEARRLTPLQAMVATHYQDGEFDHIESQHDAKDVGDGLFTFCVNEAGDAGDKAEFIDMLNRAIEQLRSLVGELEAVDGRVGEATTTEGCMQPMPDKPTPTTDLLKRCAEIHEWRSTGILSGEALRDYAKRKWPGRLDTLQMAEHETVSEALALLAKLGQPAQAAEPVAWLNPWRADQVTTDYDAYGERGIPLYTAPQPAPAPLSESEYKRGYRDGYERRDAEVRGALV